MKAIITSLFMLLSLIVFSQDTIKIIGRYKGVDISFNPFDESYTTDDHFNVFKTSITYISVNGVAYPDKVNTYPFTIELDKMGLKKRDKVEVLIVCKDRNKISIKPPEGLKIIP